MTDHNLDPLNSFKNDLRSVLTSEKDGIPLHLVNKVYRELLGEDIYFRKYNFHSLEEFLSSKLLEDTCIVERSDYKTFVKPVLTEKQSHISEFVQNQKNKFANKKPPKFPKQGDGFRNRFSKFSSTGRKPFSRSLLSNNGRNRSPLKRVPDLRYGNRDQISFGRRIFTNCRSPDRRSRDRPRSRSRERNFRENSLDDEEQRKERRRRRFSRDADRSSKPSTTFVIDKSPTRNNSPALNDNYRKNSSFDDSFKRRNRSTSRTRRSRSTSRNRKSRSPPRRDERERSRRRSRTSPRRDEKEKSIRTRSPLRNRTPQKRDENDRSRRSRSSPRRDEKDRSRKRSRSRERIGKDQKENSKNRPFNNSSIRDRSQDRFVDSYLDNTASKNKFKDCPSRHSPAKQNNFVNLIKNYLEDKKSVSNNNTNKSTNNSITNNSVPKNIISYDDILKKNILFDIRAKNKQNGSFDIKASGGLSNDLNNKDNLVNNLSKTSDHNGNYNNKYNNITHDDYMEISDDGQISPSIREVNGAQFTKEIKKPKTVIKDPRLMKRSERMQVNQILNGNASKQNSPNIDNNDDEDIKELLYDTKFSKIRDYSPERYKKKIIHNIQSINSSYEYADSKSTKFDYNDNEINSSISKTKETFTKPLNDGSPLITHQSLRSFSKNQEPNQSVVKSRSVPKGNHVLNGSDSDYEVDNEMDYETDEMDNESENSIINDLHLPDLPHINNVLINPFNIEPPEPKELVLLSRVLILKSVSAIPKVFLEMAKPPVKISSCNKITESDLNYIISKGGLEPVNLDNKVNYKIELKKFIEDYRLPEPSYTTYVYGENETLNSYVSTLTIGDKKWHCILKISDAITDVENSVSKKALDELRRLNNDNSPNNKNLIEAPVDHEMISKIVRLFENENKPLYCSIVETKFSNIYNEKLPQNWIEMIKESDLLEMNEIKVNDNLVHTVKLK